MHMPFDFHKSKTYIWCNLLVGSYQLILSKYTHRLHHYIWRTGLSCIEDSLKGEKTHKMLLQLERFHAQN